MPHTQVQKEQTLLTGLFLIIATFTFITPSTPGANSIGEGALANLMLLFFVAINVIGVLAISARHNNTEINTIVKKYFCKRLSIYEHRKLTVPTSTALLMASAWLMFITAAYAITIGFLSLLFGIIYLVTQAILTDPSGFMTGFISGLQTGIQAIYPKLPEILLLITAIFGMLFILTSKAVKSIGKSISTYIAQKLEITCDYAFPETVTTIFDDIESLSEPDKKAFAKGIDSVLKGIGVET